MEKKFKGILALLCAVFIWGTTFVAQSVGMDHIGPYTFQAIRCSLAVLALIPLVWVRERLSGLTDIWSRWLDPALWKAGLPCGLALFTATTLQQVGLIDTDAGKSGFITAMYIVLVPVFGLFLKHKPPKTTIPSVLIAVVGLYLLSCTGSSGINRGDILTMGCAAAFAVQILLIEGVADKFDGMRLNCVQALVCAVLSGLFMILGREKSDLQGIVNCWFPLVYAGVMSMGIAYSMQIIGQKHIPSTAASLIMSLESVIAVISGCLILKETLTVAETLGCVLVFSAVILSQIPVKEKNRAA